MINVGFQCKLPGEIKTKKRMPTFGWDECGRKLLVKLFNALVERFVDSFSRIFFENEFAKEGILLLVLKINDASLSKSSP